MFCRETGSQLKLPPASKLLTHQAAVVQPMLLQVLDLLPRQVALGDLP